MASLPEHHPADARPEQDPVRDRASRSRRRWRSGAEWAAVIVLALVAALLVKTYVIQTFFIPSGSMEPTLQVGDRVFVDKLSYHLHAVHRGDIVVFTLPPDKRIPGDDDLIKRVIGLPGDTIEAHGGDVYIDGRKLSEPWLPRGTVTTLLPRQLVPKDRYFLMGDNRTFSKDSRYFGPVPGKLIVGRAFIRVWPISRVGLL